MFGGNFAPRGWALADGQLLSISSNQSLFSILGTTYGGDGRTVFALPDLRGRVAVHAGRGPGLSNYVLGQKGGVETTTMTAAQMPSHNHTVNAYALEGDAAAPVNTFPAKSGQGDPDYNTTRTDTDGTNGTTLNSSTISHAGGNQAQTNIQPYNTVNYIVCLQGFYPSRN
ncbi:MAG: phage tail protein [Nitrospira sp.]|nr:phage tail protein [bacterium]MBL7050154.1 phage tail protein [Nitrospira sp.]